MRKVEIQSRASFISVLATRVKTATFPTRNSVAHIGVRGTEQHSSFPTTLAYNLAAKRDPVVSKISVSFCAVPYDRGYTERNSLVGSL